MSRVEVTIMGQSLVLSSPDGEEDALRDASQRVDAAMCRIREWPMAQSPRPPKPPHKMPLHPMLLRHPPLIKPRSKKSWPA